jgi:cell division protein FtsQ
MGAAKLIGGIVGAGVCIAIPIIFWNSEYPTKISSAFDDLFNSVTQKIGFQVRDVLLSGRHYANAQQIREVISLEYGEPIYRYSPQEIREKLEQINWIRKASVQRQLPDTLYITLEERKPIALWQHQKKHFLVDEEGIVISSEIPPEFANLPVVVGNDAPIHAPTLLKLLEKFPEIKARITGIVRVGERRWNLQIDQSCDIKLPEEKPEEGLVRFSLLLKNGKIDTKEVSTHDLRLPKQVIMKLTPSAMIRLQGKGKEA